MKGLRMTRSYRSYTYFVRQVSRFASKFTVNPLERLGVVVGLIKTRQKTLLWTKNHTWNPVVPPDPVPDALRQNRHHHSRASPSIELTDYSTVPLNDRTVYETPAMAHSLFPPAITTRRPRNESDASNYDLGIPIYEQHRLRSSEDSSDPLIQRPDYCHRSRASRGGKGSTKDRRASDDTDAGSEIDLASPFDVSHFEESSHGGWLGSTLQSRQGYRRANSDPGSQPIDLVPFESVGGLGISTTDVRENDKH